MAVKHVPLRLVLGPKSFEYVFRVTKNMRFYEWTEEEVETLFTDLKESMESFKHDGRLAPYMRYELNQIMVMKETMNSMSVFEVMDGQQRLVTLCLLYCALRDALNKRDRIEGSQRPGVEELQRELQDSVICTSYGMDPCPRVTLRAKHNSIFQQLLRGTAPVRKTGKDRDPVQQRIVRNYWLLFEMVLDAVSENPDFVSDFYQFLRNNVFVYLNIPESYTVARKLVGGLRKGKDVEPIDDLKAMVVFMGIEREQDQDIYLEKWITMEESLTREIVQQACLLTAQSTLRVRCKRDGELELLESHWKKFGGGANGGTRYFDDNIFPAASTLYNFRNGYFEQETSDLDTRQRLVFLRDACLLNAAKPIEVAVFCLLRKKNDPANARWRNFLPVLERLALLFCTTEIKVGERRARVFETAAALEHGESIDGLDLTQSERKEIVRSLFATKWGEKSAKVKAVTAVLRRLDAAVAAESSEAHIEGAITLEHVLPQKPAPASEWLRDWDDSEREKWTHRLGNLCILNGKKNSSARNRSFVEKRALYNQTIFPMTLSIAAEEQWTPNQVSLRQNRILRLCIEQFGLGAIQDFL